MSSQQLSTEERKHLRFARIAIYAFPMLAGLVTMSLTIVVERFAGGRDAGRVLAVAGGANAFLAGLASAIVVAKQHPRERGKWWRAGASFLFALPMTFIATVTFAMCAGCAGVIR